MFQDTIQSPKPVFSKQINCSRKELSRISSPFVIFFSSIFDVNSGSFQIHLTFGLACLLELNQFLGGAEREVGKISNTFVVLYSLTTTAIASNGECRCAICKFARIGCVLIWWNLWFIGDALLVGLRFHWIKTKTARRGWVSHGWTFVGGPVNGSLTLLGISFGARSYEINH